MGKKETSIVIIGGGITGLAAAYYLQQQTEQLKTPYNIQLLEASHRFGGKIRTERKDGFIIERGPDSFLGRKRPAIRLVESLQIENQLVRNTTGQAYILSNDVLHKMPPGSFMGVPTTLQPFLETSLLSKRGKARTGLDFILPRSTFVGDQSLGYFLRRRFGDELIDHIIEPLLSGIYAGDIDEMSLYATFPQFFELEQAHKSIIKGIRNTMGKRSANTGEKTGQFCTFTNGLDTLVTALEHAISPSVLKKNHFVERIEQKSNTYTIHCQNGERIEADVVLATTPHHLLEKIVGNNSYMDRLFDMTSNSVANVALAYDTDDLGPTLDGTGFVISRHSNYRITACTWTHKKWQHTTPEGRALLRAYVGKPTDQSVVHLSDEEITEIALQDIEKSIGIKKEPTFSVVTRWDNAMPQYSVGHKARVLHTKRTLEKEMPGFFLAGSSLEGVGIPDCIGQAEEVVRQIIEYVQTKTI